MRLGGKVAIITGGAHGMGESEAMIFAREGASVVVADVDQPAGQQVAAKITADGGTARFARLDVTNEAEWQEVVRATTSAYGRLDILVNNAGSAARRTPTPPAPRHGTPSWASMPRASSSA